MSSNKVLSKEQNQGVLLLSIGTFLEYFDLMLYVHMAVLLNELFFSQTDPFTTKLVTIFTFCSTFILRPVGGFIVGWVGDHIGRKNTVIITTILMAICCIIMANLKTYSDIGIMASFTVIFCRMLQGFTSMGEILGAQLYIMESLKPPYSYICTSIINIQSKLGGSFALLVAYFATSIAFDWRIAFWIGAIIAIVGIVARTKLRETPEFIDYKKRLRIQTELEKQNNNTLINSNIVKEKLDKKIVLSYFIMHLPFAIYFYIAYIYTVPFMKVKLGMNSEQIITQNLKFSALHLIFLLLVIPLLKKFHPLKLAKVSIIVSSILVLSLPYLFKITDNLISLIFLQLLVLLFPSFTSPTELTCFKHIPISKRFKILGIAFGIASVIGYGVAPIILEFSKVFIGDFCIWLICIPGMICYWLAVKYMEKIEKNAGRFDNYPEDDPINADTGLDENQYNYIMSEEYKLYNLDCDFSKSLLTKLVNLNKIARRKVNIKFIEKSIIFAKKWHDGQTRKTGEPFYSHPLTVAEIAAEYYFKTDVIIAAILHDIVEDTECTLDDVRENFNSRIAQIVDRLTRVSFINGEKIKIPFDDVIANLINVKDNEALFIKQIDRIHNMITIEGLSPEKQKKIAAETNSILIGTIAFVFEKLNIPNKFKIESKISKLVKNILNKK